MSAITKELLNAVDDAYKTFSKKLIPDTNLEILGVRVPKIKAIAKKFTNTNDAKEFLSCDHKYYEEWFLHGLLLSSLKCDIDVIFNCLDKFLPHVDNWAICDSVAAALKIFNKHSDKVLNKIKEWILSPNPYTVRFAIVILLDYFLGDKFDEKIFDIVINAACEHYYINMAIAWFISVALIKQYDSAVKILIDKRLPKFVHNKSIQKASESFRIDAATKSYLKSLKI